MIKMFNIQNRVLYDTQPAITVICGQSNCGNPQFEQLNSQAQLDWGGVMPNAYMLNPFVDASNFHPLEIGVNTMLMNADFNITNPGGFGSEVSFAKSAITATGSTQYIIKFAYGSTNLKDNWKSPDGTYHPALRTHIATGIAAAKAIHPTAYLKQFIWIQGEHDTRSVPESSSYFANLGTFFSGLRAYAGSLDSASGNFKALITVVPAGAAYLAEVRQAQVDYCAIGGNNAVLIQTSDIPLSDGLHYTAAGTITLGQRIYTNT